MPTNATVVQEFHWDNYTVAQTVNFGTGKIELTIGHPTDTATQPWAITQLPLKADDAAVTTTFASMNVELS